jgi:hypothetical protein
VGVIEDVFINNGSRDAGVSEIGVLDEKVRRGVGLPMGPANPMPLSSRPRCPRDLEVDPGGGLGFLPDPITPTLPANPLPLVLGRLFMLAPALALEVWVLIEQVEGDSRPSAREWEKGA